MARTFKFNITYGAPVNRCIGGGRVIFCIDFVDQDLQRRTAMVLQFMAKNICKTYVTDKKGRFYHWGIKKSDSKKAIDRTLFKVNEIIKKSFKPYELPGNQY